MMLAQELFLGIQHSDLPFVDAIFNGLATICIVMGWIAIKRGKENVHKRWMITALVFSTCFLSCYLIYHFGPKEPTHFQGEGIARTLYFILLISHIVLAAVIVPLILITLFFAAKGQLTKHRKIARFTLPLWLYVSVTGVLVYLVLYEFQ
ncbi:MAG: hypothetical protein CSA62_11305 [Planctomycetota bacterium]|nr:MAG: hypothetical protein CSA62_11305 [Planctomycetota bacterium]